MTTLNRPEPSGGSTSAETLIKRAHVLLNETLGIGGELSPSKISRLVREYHRKAEPHGKNFEVFITEAVRDTRDERARQAAFRVLTPEERAGRPVRPGKHGSISRDHQTGEVATWNVFVDRELQDIYAMADVSDEQFEEVIAEARKEGDLSRANVASKCRVKATRHVSPRNAETLGI